jgi:hypothetical protein
VAEADAAYLDGQQAALGHFHQRRRDFRRTTVRIGFLGVGLGTVLAFIIVAYYGGLVDTVIRGIVARIEASAMEVSWWVELTVRPGCLEALFFV